MGFVHAQISFPPVRWLLGLAAIAATSGAWALTAGTPRLVSRNFLGDAALGPCLAPTLAGHGRFVTFFCISSDLVASDDNDRYDTFLLDRSTQQIRRVSLNANNEEQRNHSGFGFATSGGDSVVFLGEGKFHPDVGVLPPPPADSDQANVFLRTFSPPGTALLGRAANGEGNPERRGAFLEDALPDRQEILFTSSANYLSDGANMEPRRRALYVRNWGTGAVERINNRPDGTRSLYDAGQGALSPDGRFVVYNSIATDLTADNPQRYQQLFLHDRVARTTRRLTFPWQGGEFSPAAGAMTNFTIRPSLSMQGRSLLFAAALNDEFAPDDNPGVGDVYLMDVASGDITVISHSHDGTPTDGTATGAAMSEDGRIIAYFTRATNTLPTPNPDSAIYVRDMATGQVVNITASLGSMPVGIWPYISVSPSGNLVAFNWITEDPSYPAVNRRQMIYTVELRGITPTTPPVPVPTLSLWMAWLLAAGMAVLAAMGTATIRQRIARH